MWICNIIGRVGSQIPRLIFGRQRLLLLLLRPKSISSRRNSFLSLAAAYSNKPATIPLLATMRQFFANCTLPLCGTSESFPGKLRELAASPHNSAGAPSDGRAVSHADGQGSCEVRRRRRRSRQSRFRRHSLSHEQICTRISRQPAAMDAGCLPGLLVWAPQRISQKEPDLLLRGLLSG